MNTLIKVVFLFNFFSLSTEFVITKKFIKNERIHYASSAIASFMECLSEEGIVRFRIVAFDHPIALEIANKVLKLTALSSYKVEFNKTEYFKQHNVVHKHVKVDVSYSYIILSPAPTCTIPLLQYG